MADTPAAKKPAAAKKAPAKKATAARKPAARKPAAPVDARAKFSKAIDEARAGATALGKEAQAKAGIYRDQMTAKGTDWVEEAKTMADQAKGKAGELAQDGKARTSDAIASLGKIVSQNAGAIDDKLGTRYGDYARTAARSMQETAAKIDSKELGELGEDAKEFVRKSPGLAVGLAAVAGFFLARLFRGGSSED